MSLRADFGRIAERLWYGDSSLRWLLLPFSLMFGAVVAARRLAYRWGLLPSGHPGVPVIVVGNITVGGTGKTPFVAWLATRLAVAGMRPAIISRGYGSRPHHGTLTVRADSEADVVGDEPLLLARKTGVPVMVDHRRFRAARRAVEAGATVIVADDGLQHYALGRDCEIAIVDARRGHGNGLLLPAGPLREPPGRLGEVTLVLHHGSPPRGSALGFSLQPCQLVALSDGRQVPLSRLAGREVLAVAGIGDPTRFADTLRAGGLRPIVVAVPDHGLVDLALLRAGNDHPIVMTEKDAVKYPHCRDGDTWYLPVDVMVDSATMAELGRALRRVLPSLPAGFDYGPRP